MHDRVMFSNAQGLIGGLLGFCRIAVRLDTKNIRCHLQCMSRRTRDPEAKRTALIALRRGYPASEVARLAGVSRQLVESWARHAGVDVAMIQAKKAHYQNMRLLWLWNREMDGGSRLVQERKTRARRRR